MELKYIVSKSIRIIMFLLFMQALVPEVKAQTQPFRYTEYMNNLTPLNPAYSLLDNTASINAISRKQWVGVDGAPTTLFLNGNIPLESMNASTGLTVMNDQFAVERQTEVNAYFAKAIQTGMKEFLAVSLNLGVRNYVANYSTLDSTDPLFANDVRQTRPNVGFGVMYYSDTYYLGLSVPELSITTLGTASLQNASNFVNHYYFSGGYITDLSEDIKFKPAMLVSYAKGVPLTTDFSGTFYLKEKVGFGLNYRTNNEMAGLFTVYFDKFDIGYSYEFGTSGNNLGGINIPTHEISIAYRFGKGSNKRKLL